MSDPLSSAHDALGVVAKTLAAHGAVQFEHILETHGPGPTPVDSLTTLSMFRRGLALLESLNELGTEERADLEQRLRVKGTAFASDSSVLLASAQAGQSIAGAVEALCPRLQAALSRSCQEHSEAVLRRDLPPFLQARFVLSANRMLQLAFLETEPALMAFLSSLAKLPPTERAPWESYWSWLAPTFPELAVQRLRLSVSEWSTSALLGVLDPPPPTGALAQSIRARMVLRTQGASCIAQVPQKAAAAMRALGAQVAEQVVVQSQSLCTDALRQAQWLHRLAMARAGASDEGPGRDVHRLRTLLELREADLTAALLSAAGLQGY